MNKEEIINEMVAITNNENLDWSELQRYSDHKSKEDILSYIDQLIEELEELKANALLEKNYLKEGKTMNAKKKPVSKKKTAKKAK